MKQKTSRPFSMFKKTAQHLSLGLAGVVAIFGVRQDEQVMALEHESKHTGKQNEIKMDTQKLYMYQKQTKIPAVTELAQKKTRIVASAPISSNNIKQESTDVGSLQNSQSTSNSQSAVQSTSLKTMESTSQKASESTSTHSANDLSQKNSQLKVSESQSQKMSETSSSSLLLAEEKQSGSTTTSESTASSKSSSESNYSPFVMSVMNSQSLSLSVSESLVHPNSTSQETSELVSDFLQDDFDLDFWLS